MDVKHWAREKNRNMRRKMLERDADTRGFHSWSYHKHFEGYTEYRRLQQNGSTKLIREYTGKWYQQSLTSAQRIGLRVLHLLLFVLMTACFILAGTSAGTSGASWYAAIVGLASILFMTAMGYTLLINYLFAPVRMTIGEYKSASGSLKVTAIGVAVCNLLGALMTLVYMVLHMKTIGVGLLITIAEYLLSGAIALLIYKLESSIKYDIYDNHTDVPEDGVEITVDN